MVSSPSAGAGEQQFEIAAQMIERGDRDRGVLRRLREDKGALNHRLGVERETACGPSPGRAVLAHRRRDVGLQRCGVPEDGFAAGIADGRMRLMDFLHRGAGEAGELARLATDERLAEIDVGEQAVQRIRQFAVGGRGEQVGRRRTPPLDGGERQVFLAVEVMKEAAFGEAGGGANVVDARRRIAFGADNAYRRVDKLDLGLVLGLGHVIPTSRYDRYRLDGMLSSLTPTGEGDRRLLAPWGRGSEVTREGDACALLYDPPGKGDGKYDAPTGQRMKSQNKK